MPTNNDSMSYYEKQYRNRFSLGQRNNALVLLFAVNMILFVSLAFVRAFYYLRYHEGNVAVQHFDETILSWFVLPAKMSTFITRPWTIITHAFIHVRVWHLLANMLWLWFFGFIMQDLTGNRKLIPVFLYGALAGALSFVLAFNLLPGLKDQLPYATAMGSSAAIMAIAAAATTVAPGYRLLPMINGGIPLWVITGIYVIIDLATIPVENPGGHIAHMAGALAGFLFIFFLRKGYDGSDWMNRSYDWLNNLCNPEKPKKGKTIKEELFYKSSARPFTKTPNVTQQRIDDILDKISQKGYHHLTEEEKELLKRAGQEGL